MLLHHAPKLLILCTLRTGIDSVVEMIRRETPISAIIGLHPDVVDPVKISGWLDIAAFAQRWGIPFHYVESYGLSSIKDKALIESINFDLAWVCGWQRLVPAWLIQIARLGVIGGHGSPDGITAGRGRSPQNWAIMLGCKRFDLVLFRITEGVDDGPILLTRSIFYGDGDDIGVSYHRVSLAMAEMVAIVLSDPDKLLYGTPQSKNAFYYPQRIPEDGCVDWSLSQSIISSHCRALTRPYPGLRTYYEDNQITLWSCHPFDDVIDAREGQISACFEDGEFLVNCRDGRLLIRQWEATNPSWRPKSGIMLSGKSFQEQLLTIATRHLAKYPDRPISDRIKRFIK